MNDQRPKVRNQWPYPCNPRWSIFAGLPALVHKLATRGVPGSFLLRSYSAPTRILPPSYLAPTRILLPKNAENEAETSNSQSKKIHSAGEQVYGPTKSIQRKPPSEAESSLSRTGLVTLVFLVVASPPKSVVSK